MQKHMNRRDFLKVASLASGAGILAACQPAAKATEAPKAAEGAKAPAAEEVTITFTGWGGTEEDEGVKAAVKYYQDNNPGMKVTWIQIPENYDDKTLAMVASGTPPKSDRSHVVL